MAHHVLACALDDENQGQHERSYFEVIKCQKLIFEKQRQEMSKMRSGAAIIGDSFHAKMLQRTMAQEWVERERGKRGIAACENMDIDSGGDEKKEGSAGTSPSAVLSVLEKEGRKQMKLSIPPLKKRSGKKRPRFAFEDD